MVKKKKKLVGRICCLFPWFKLHASGVSVHFITLGIRALRHVDWLILTTSWEEAIAGRQAHFREKHLKRDTIQTGSDGHSETKSLN